MEVISPILDGLREVHSKNLLHRDIKPENILLSSTGQPMLIDFGSARTSIGATMSMTSIVTHGYSPIEQYQTKGRMGPWTDIYALGAVMCRAITGEKPPVAADRLMADDFEWLSYRSFEGFSPVFLRTVDWALRVKPEERPPSILEWREILSANADEIIERVDQSDAVPPVTEPVQPPPITPPQSLKTDPLSIWSLVLGILSIIGCSFGGVILAIPAVLCGHFGMASIKKNSPRNGYGLAYAGLVLGYAVIGGTLIAVPLALPAINGAKERSNKIKQQQEQQKAQTKAEYLNAVSDLEKDVKKIFEEPQGTNALPKNTPVIFNDKPEGDSQEKQLVALVRSFNNDLLSFQKDYESALDKAGINELLDPERIESDHGFIQSRRILSKMREAVQLYRTKSINLLSDFPKKLDNYGFSDSVKKSFLKGYQEGIAKSGPLIKETWDLELVICNSSNELLNHLESSQSRWKAKDGNFIFETDEDLEKFNYIIKKVNACVQRQEEIRKKSQNATLKNFENLKDKVQQ
jgi:serine/threonine protein kinase